MRQWLLQFCLDRYTGGEDFKVSNTHEKAMNGKISRVHVKGLYHCICTACNVHFERLKTIDLFSYQISKVEKSVWISWSVFYSVAVAFFGLLRNKFCRISGVRSCVEETIVQRESKVRDKKNWHKTRHKFDLSIPLILSLLAWLTTTRAPGRSPVVTQKNKACWKVKS